MNVASNHFDEMLACTFQCLGCIRKFLLVVQTIKAAVIDCHSTCIILSKNVKQKFMCLKIYLTFYYSIKVEWDCDK